MSLYQTRLSLLSLDLSISIIFVHTYIYGRRAEPHPIYNIPGCVSLSLYIYIFMRAGQTSPHVEYV